MSYIHDPAHWKHRAAEMRALAAEVKAADIKKTMLSLAADYEKLARRVTRGQNQKSPHRPTRNR